MSPKVLTLKNKQAEAADGTDRTTGWARKHADADDTSQRRRGGPGRSPERVPAVQTQAERGPHHPGREAVLGVRQEPEAGVESWRNGRCNLVPDFQTPNAKLTG